MDLPAGDAEHSIGGHNASDDVDDGSPRSSTSSSRLAREYERLDSTPDEHASEATSNVEPVRSMLMQDASHEPRIATKGRLEYRTGSYFLSVWWREAMAAFLVAAAAIASFATLFPYQDKPLPEWPYLVTIGALLSAYSVVLRLASGFLLAEGLAQLKWRWFDKTRRPLHDLVLQDDATRGPFGAAGLLWKYPLPVSWQWLGCLLVVASLLTGPFTQQVLQYYPCAAPTHPGERLASIPKASVFMGQGAHHYAGANTLTVTEQAAVNAGIYSPGRVAYSCESGNCTVGVYKSIGYCARCDDVSSQVQVRVVNMTSQDNSYRTSQDESSGHIASATSFIVNGTSVTWAADDESTYYATSGKSHTDFQILIGLPGKPTDPVTMERPLGCDDEATNQTWRCQGYGAANCGLVPCVRSYNTTIVNGEFQEIVVAEHRAFYSTQFQIYADVALDLQCVEVGDRAYLREAGYAFNDSDSLIPYNVTADEYRGEYREYDNSATTDNHPLEERAAFNNRLLDAGCLYLVDRLFHGGLVIYIHNAFTANLTGTTNQNYHNPDVLNFITHFNGSPLLQTIYNYGNFSLARTLDVFNNMSLSLTNHMRTNPGRALGRNTSAPARGINSTMKTCVRVEWAWLALPVAVAALTLAFFVGVVLSSGRLTRSARTWKSSPLPLIFNGPSVSEMAQHVDDMNRVAKGIRVRLVRDGEGNMRLEQQSKEDGAA